MDVFVVILWMWIGQRFEETRMEGLGRGDAWRGRRQSRRTGRATRPRPNASALKASLPEGRDIAGPRARQLVPWRHYAPGTELAHGNLHAEIRLVTKRQDRMTRNGIRMDIDVLGQHVGVGLALPPYLDGSSGL
jgi:hypothetical protein